jgi:hypothetical protein
MVHRMYDDGSLLMLSSQHRRLRLRVITSVAMTRAGTLGERHRSIVFLCLPFCIFFNRKYQNV